MNELISVVIPVYNVEQYLAKCLDSVCNQSYKNIEIILVNDGSTDSSKEICTLFKKKDQRIILIDKENGGLSSARNVGIEHSRGKYITFVDSDDILDLQYVEKMFENLRNNKLDMIMCGHSRFINHSRIVEDSKNNNGYVEINSEQLLEEIFYQKNQEILSVSAWAKLFKRNIFDNIRFPEGKLNEDMAIIVPIVLNCKKIGYLNKKMYFYRINPNSITQQKFSEKRMDVIEISKQILSEVKMYDNVARAAQILLFSRAMEMLCIASYSTNKYEYCNEKQELTQIINKYKKIVCFDNKARLKARICAFICLFNPGFACYILHHIRKRRYTIE